MSVIGSVANSGEPFTGTYWESRAPGLLNGRDARFKFREELEEAF